MMPHITRARTNNNSIIRESNKEKMASGGLNEPLIKDTTDVLDSRAKEKSDNGLSEDKCSDFLDSPSDALFSTVAVCILTAAACKQSFYHV